MYGTQYIGYTLVRSTHRQDNTKNVCELCDKFSLFTFPKIQCISTHRKINLRRETTSMFSHLSSK